MRTVEQQLTHARQVHRSTGRNKIANATFRQVAYHTLFYSDLYLSPSLEALEPTEIQHRGGLHPAGVATCVGLTKDDTLAYLAACRRKAVQTLAAETPQSLQVGAGFPWLSLSRGELHWYNIRHIQHHTGQLSAYLRRATGSREDWWVDSGWQ